MPFCGNRAVLAPSMNQLAEKSVVFENCYCNLPMCGPSRASMHAGRMPFDIEMYDNASEFRSGIPTFAHYLRSMGYRTQLSGKMHFVGADQLHGYEVRHTTEIYPANFMWTVDWSKGREYRPTNLTMSSIIASGPCVRTLQMDYDDEVAFHGVQAIYDLARKGDDRPWLLTVSFTQPHSPFVISHEYWDRYKHDDIELPTVPAISLEDMDHLSRNLHYCQAQHQFAVTDEHRRYARHGYYGMISYIDDKVALLTDTLEKCGLADGTVVILTSDHGEMMGERGMWFKQHFFEWACRVPFVVHAPGRFKPARIRRNVSLIDLMPTILDLASDVPFIGYVGNGITGKSLVPAMEGELTSLNDIVISEFAADGSTGPSRMVKRDQWKYMYLEGVDELLYDIGSDPNEIKNQIGNPKYADIASELREIALEDWDPEWQREAIRADQERRLFVHQSTGGVPTWVHVVRTDDGLRYIRNAGAAETKAKARLPYIPPAEPDCIA